MEKIDELDDITLNDEDEKDSILNSVTNSESPKPSQRQVSNPSIEQVVGQTRFVKLQNPALNKVMKEEPDIKTPESGRHMKITDRSFSKKSPRIERHLRVKLNREHIVDASKLIQSVRSP